MRQQSPFTEFPLDKKLLETLDHLGFTHLTEIQEKAVPVGLSGQDLLASSKTGSGKTLAYLIPAMQRMLRQKAYSKRDPRALILAPTRELAKQVYAQVRTLVANTNLRAAKILGGENFNDQFMLLRKNPHIIVATPGRIADHIKQKHVYLEGLELLILDEADRMLDLGFEAQLRFINQCADHRKRQTFLFSATLDHAAAHEFAGELLNNPRRVAIGAGHEKHEDISQLFYLADNVTHKEKMLAKLLASDDVKQAIVFTATREDTERLATLMQDTLKTCALSGKLTQGQRNSIMDQFARGHYDVLFTTDVASRGLDLANVSHVINFDLPKHSEEYIHRVGRTGRAGAKGQAFSLVGPKDWNSYKAIETFLQTNISFDELEGLKAKFNGLSAKKPQQKRTHSNKHQATDARKAHQKKTRSPKKRDKSFFTGVDGGFSPMRKKPKPIAPPEPDTEGSAGDEPAAE